MEIEPENEEYEVVPLSPIRKLEKRIDQLEGEKEVGNTKAIVNEVMDLVKSNQQMVDEIVKSNDELRKELEKIPEKVDEILGQWEEFLEALRKGSEKMEREGPSENISKKMDKLIEENKSMGEITEQNKKMDKLIEQNGELIDSMKSLKRAVKGSRSLSKSRGSSKSSSPKVRIKKEKR